MNPIIYLYVKESPLGLKYLGQTKEDPFKYKGSGKIWKRHIKKYGFSYKDIKTTILFQTTDREELKQKGIYYSELWNIVEDERWANLIPETGECSTLGYRFSPEDKERLSKTMKERMKNYPLSQEAREKISKANKGRPKTEKQKQSAANVWKGKKLPKYIIEAMRESHSVKVVHKITGEIFPTILEAARSIGMSENTLHGHLHRAHESCQFKFMDEELNKKAIEFRETRKIKMAKRVDKKILTKSSKYKGVHWDKSKKKWTAQIRIGDGKKFLGRYENEKEAAKAYQKAFLKIQLDHIQNKAA